MVQSLGLFSSTALVIGSMIGSGIFLVDSDIARVTNSPALYLGAWIVTGILTMIAALSYGELAAMMPKAGGQYVYLRESLGPLWGFLYGWTLFVVIQTGTIAAVCVAFGKFLGVFFPSVSTSNWLWHIAHVPPIHIGPMVLGNMDIGVNTANLTGIVIVFLLAFVNVFGVKLGRRDDSEHLPLRQRPLARRTCHPRPHHRTQRHRRQLRLRRTLHPVLDQRGLAHIACGSGWSGRAHRDGQPARPFSPSCRSARSSRLTRGTTSPSPPAK